MAEIQAITLARRVQSAREDRGMSQAKLAEQAFMPLQQIQDIEAGIELFLAPAVRQKLARVLKLRPQELKALETPMPAHRPALSAEGRERFIEEILHYPNQPYACPACNAPLVVRLFHRRDIEDNPLVEVKATCSECLFKI